VARAPGHSIGTEADSWAALREKAVAAASLHFKDAPARPDLIRLHLVKDELVAARTGEPVSETAPEAWLRELEPALATPSELEGMLADLSRREPIFHRPEFGTSRADFERMTAEDYWETGASGRRYSRQSVLGRPGGALLRPPRRRLGDERLPLPQIVGGYLPADLHAAPGPPAPHPADYHLAEDSRRLEDCLPSGNHRAGCLRSAAGRQSPTCPAPPQNPAPRAGRA